MSRQAPVRDVAPTVQKVRMHYAKRGRLRFSSHRDFQRAFERALRRCEVPMAYSQGFNPHPKISYANAAPTGVASEAEYVEFSLISECDTDALRDALDASLPPGLDVLEVVTARQGDFVARLEVSDWLIELPGVDQAAADEAAAAFMAAEVVEVERMTKNGIRRFDARSAVLTVESGVSGADGAVPEVGCAILKAVSRHVTPSVRPDDLLAGLKIVADLVPPAPPRVTRLAQGPLNSDGATVGDPFAPDRSA